MIKTFLFGKRNSKRSEFKAKVGKPIWDEWVAANKDQFDAQAVLDVILNYK